MKNNFSEVSDEETEDRNSSRLFRGLNIVMMLCMLVSFGEIVAGLGWTLEGLHLDIVGGLSIGTVFFFFVQEIFRLFLSPCSVWEYLWKYKTESSLLTLIPTVFFVLWFSDIELSQKLLQNCLTGIHGIILLIVAVRALRNRRRLFAGKSLTPGRVFILSFLILIVVGTLMLMTPNATKNGLSFVDALFFSTSAVCVTGLVPVESLSDTLTKFGQLILLVLAQFGGLSVMSIMYFFAYFFAGGLSIRNRFAFRDLFSEDNPSQIGSVLGVMFIFTFSVEALGAFWIYFSYAVDSELVSDPIFFSIFHSVMAFCNAGFSTLPEGLATGDIPTCYSFISAIIVLTIIGGIGFPVVKNLWMIGTDWLRRTLLHQRGKVPERLTVHTKLVLTTTGLLFFGGIALLYLTGLHTQGGTFTRAIFLSATSRTAGFDIGDAGSLATGTLLVVMVLMFIGGAPFSTAGGIKVTTFAVAVLSVWQTLSGKRDLEVFGRRLHSDVANQALAIVLLSSAALALVAIALCTLHPEMSESYLLFESVSAIATVGLSCNVTPHLCSEAKCILILAMFVGRIGVLLFLLSFIRRREPTGARFPEEKIVLS